jgi:hypothetical protein
LEGKNRNLSSSYSFNFKFVNDIGLQEVSGSGSKMPEVSPVIDNEKLREMMTFWVINRQRPFTIVEDAELIEMIKYLNPTAKPVKADSIKRTIMRFYDEGQKAMEVSYRN